MAKKVAKSSGRRKTAAKRQRLDTRSDQRYVRRGTRGQFTESDDVGRAAASDQRRRAKTTPARGQGDKGDRRPTSTASKKR